jgi:hypothetical protein
MDSLYPVVCGGPPPTAPTMYAWRTIEIAEGFGVRQSPAALG